MRSLRSKDNATRWGPLASRKQQSLWVYTKCQQESGNRPGWAQRGPGWRSGVCRTKNENRILLSQKRLRGAVPAPPSPLPRGGRADENQETPLPRAYQPCLSPPPLTTGAQRPEAAPFFSRALVLSAPWRAGYSHPLPCVLAPGCSASHLPWWLSSPQWTQGCT